jgi:hypothetical protein
MFIKFIGDDILSSYQDLIPVFHPLLGKVKWHRSLAIIIQDFLNNENFTNITIDKFLSSVTKGIETYLREAVQSFLGVKIPTERSYGLNLLNYAKTKDFIPEPKRGANSIFHLIYWFFEKPRNLTHHSFTDFQLPTINLIICSANYILTEIDHLKQELNFYDANRQIEYRPEFDILSVSVKDITKDDEIIDPPQLEMWLYTPEKTTSKYPLINQGNQWKLQIPTGIFSAGTYRVDLVGYDQQNNRFNISGANLVKVQTIES